MAETNLDHLVITPPDRYHGEGPKILWVDWPLDMIERCLNALRGSPIKLLFHAYSPLDRDVRWLMDVAHQADIIVMDMTAGNHNDVIKGHLIAMDKTFHFGRKDLGDIFPGYIEDPQGKMLVWVGEIMDKRNP